MSGVATKRFRSARPTFTAPWLCVPFSENAPRYCFLHCRLGHYVSTSDGSEIMHPTSSSMFARLSMMMERDESHMLIKSTPPLPAIFILNIRHNAALSYVETNKQLIQLQSMISTAWRICSFPAFTFPSSHPAPPSPAQPTPTSSLSAA